MDMLTDTPIEDGEPYVDGDDSLPAALHLDQQVAGFSTLRIQISLRHPHPFTIFIEALFPMNHGSLFPVVSLASFPIPSCKCSRHVPGIEEFGPIPTGSARTCSVRILVESSHLWSLQGKLEVRIKALGLHDLWFAKMPSGWKVGC
jgi:hypothetical protein